MKLTLTALFIVLHFAPPTATTAAVINPIEPINKPIATTKRGAFILSIKKPILSKFFNSHYEGAEYLQKYYDIPMAISLGQWFIESGFGTSSIAINKMNFGGIKRNHSYVCYDSKSQFYLDYAAILSTCCYQNIDRSNLDDWTTALQWSNCKYAESNKYKSDLNKIIRKYKLDKL